MLKKSSVILSLLSYFLPLSYHTTVDQLNVEIFNLDRAFLLMNEANVDMSNWEQYAENLCVPISEISRSKKEHPTNCKIAFYECCKYWFDKMDGEKSWQSFIDSAQLERPSAKRLKRVLRRGESQYSPVLNNIFTYGPSMVYTVV